MKRVFCKDLVKKYCELSKEIDKYCEKGDYNLDYANPKHFCYDFDNGFMIFYDASDCYLVSCGFISGDDKEKAFFKCKKAIKAFLEDGDRKKKPVFARVDIGNLKMRCLMKSLNFEDTFKVYELRF